MSRKRHNLVTMAGYARRAGLSRQVISKQVREGKIPTHDGLIDPEEADRARARNVSSRRPARQTAAGLESVGIADLFDEGDISLGPPTAREVLDAVLSRRYLVPGILAELGVQDAALIHCADDLFLSLVLNLGGYIAYSPDLDDLPLVETDIKAVARKYKIKFTKATIARADKMADSACAAIERAIVESANHKPTKEK